MSTLPDYERPISETYVDTKPLINKMIATFQEKYGGDWSDWESESHEIFMKAYTRYRPEKGSFSNWLTFFLRVLFTERIRRMAMRNSRLPRVVEFEFDSYIAPERSFSITKLLRDVSDDAKLVIEAILDPPPDFTICYIDKDEEMPERDRVLDSLIEYLTDAGWSSDRVFDSFEEVSEALC